jgi:hypothetical protein
VQRRRGRAVAVTPEPHRPRGVAGRWASSIHERRRGEGRSGIREDRRPWRMDWGCRRGWAAGRRRESERSWVGLLSFFFFRLRLRARKIVPPTY